MPVKEKRLGATSDVRRIVQGEILTITVELADELSSEALNVEDATLITAALPGTTATVTVTGAPTGEPGRVSFELDADDTGALKLGEGQSWQVSIALADATIRIVQLIEQLDVIASLP